MDLDDGVTLRAADDPTIKNELRRAWIADRLDERLGEFGETHAVDVVCATWNANGKDVTKLNLDLEPWLRSRAAPADVYAIGAQEMVDLTVSNVALTGAQAAKRAEAWCGMIETALGPGYTNPVEVVADDGGDAPRGRRKGRVPPRWRGRRARARFCGGAVSTDE